MTTKTITVTEDAYEALRSLKGVRESFSKTILRIAKKRPLSDFYGILSKEAGKELEESIREVRSMHRKTHRKRIERVAKALGD